MRGPGLFAPPPPHLAPPLVFQEDFVFNVWALEPKFVFSLFFPSPKQERAVALKRAVGPENKAESDLNCDRVSCVSLAEHPCNGGLGPHSTYTTIQKSGVT